MHKALERENTYIPRTVSDVSSFHLAGVPDLDASVGGTTREQAAICYRDQPIHGSSVLVEMCDWDPTRPPIVWQ